MKQQQQSKLIRHLLAAGMLPTDAADVARRTVEAGDEVPTLLDADAYAEAYVAGGTYEASRAWWLSFVARHPKLRTLALLLEARRANLVERGGKGQEGPPN